LLRLGTEVLHHRDSPLQKVTHRRHPSPRTAASS
jgi:hypothetical protein